MMSKNNYINASELSIVIQGPISDKDKVIEVISSILQIASDAEIIVSTWNSSDTSIFESYSGQVKVVLNSDPGNFLDLNGRPYNYHRQVVSTYNGILHATRKFVLKIRTDTVMRSLDILYWDPGWDKEENILFGHGRCVMTNIVLRDPAKFPQVFSLSDVVQFSKKDVLLKLWSPGSFSECFFIHNELYRPKIWGQYTGYSRLKYVPEQRLLIELLMRNNVKFQQMNSPSDLCYENIKLYIELLSDAFHTIDYLTCGIEFPLRMTNPFYVRKTFFMANKKYDLSRFYFLRCFLNKFFCLNVNFFVSATSHCLFRFFPSLGARVRSIYHTIRRDNKFGSS